MKLTSAGLIHSCALPCEFLCNVIQVITPFLRDPYTPCLCPGVSSKSVHIPNLKLDCRAIFYIIRQAGRTNASPCSLINAARSFSFCRFFASIGKYFSRKSIVSKSIFLPSACSTVSWLQTGHLFMPSSWRWMMHRMQKTDLQQPRLTGRQAIA